MCILIISVILDGLVYIDTRYDLAHGRHEDLSIGSLDSALWQFVAEVVPQRGLPGSHDYIVGVDERAVEIEYYVFFLHRIVTNPLSYTVLSRDVV